MGFYLRCAIAKVDDIVLAERIVTLATELFPAFVRVRRFSSPFAGVIAAYDYAAAHDEYVDHWQKHGYTDEDAASDDVAEGIYSRMADLSHEFREVPFAYVDVDCFGGTCMFHGFVVVDGLQTHSESNSSSAHVRLLEKLGVPDPQWHFEPFTRGFMETGRASDLGRKPVTFYVTAHWDEPYRLAAMRAAMLHAPWRVTIHTEKSCIVTHGEQFFASLHPVHDHVEMRAKSYVELALTRTLAHELTNDDVALELKDPDGNPL